MGDRRRRVVGRAFGVASRLIRRAGLPLDLDAEHPGETLTILVVGSDARRGLPRSLRPLRAGIDERRADALGLVAIPRDGSVTMVRVPRDAFVHVPCVGHQRIGWALSYGGPQCLVDAVRATLGVPVHHYLEFGFLPFVRLATALGGLPAEIAGGRIDWRAGLDTSKRSRLTGRDVLALARSRTPHGSGPMSDLERIAVQNRILSDLGANRSTFRLFVAVALLLPRLGRDLLVDGRWSRERLERVASAFATRPLEVRTLPVHEGDPGGARRSPFAPGFDSSSRVLEFDRHGIDDVRSIAGSAVMV